MRKLSLMFPAGIVLALSGCITAPDAEQNWRYVCPDGYEFTVEYSRNRSGVVFRDEDQELKLDLIESASGSRYTDGSFVFWARGLNSLIRRDGETLHQDCVGDYDVPLTESPE